MAAVYEKAKAIIIAAEGGESNSPVDYGGYTRMGVSQKQYPYLNIKALSNEQLFHILEQDYWDEYRLSEINDQTIANQAMLLLMNMNPLKAGRIIQTAVNVSGRGLLDLKVDGVIGSVTIKAINVCVPICLQANIRVEAARYYLALTDKDKTQIANFRGWIRRALL